MWQAYHGDCVISIHAPHARSDQPHTHDEPAARRISIHAPHARSDHCHAASRKASCQFQSTLLMRGATRECGRRGPKWIISIHAPHARSDRNEFAPCDLCEISIHAPHARSDAFLRCLLLSIRTFQSTLLMRGATADFRTFCAIFYSFQSTLLMRGATRRQKWSGRPRNFNPRSSCEERLNNGANAGLSYLFQSTLLMRGATTRLSGACACHIFQSTLLMRGATRLIGSRRTCNDFNPRSSCEERRDRNDKVALPLQISIYAPHARSDTQ